MSELFGVSADDAASIGHWHSDSSTRRHNNSFNPLFPPITYTMPFLGKTVFYTGWGTLGATLGYVFLTRKNRIQPVPPTDYIYNTTLFARYNPDNRPATNDICLRKVPIGKIKPELLEAAEKGETALVERFCAGVWSGWGE